MANPLLPAHYDLVFAGVSLAVLAFTLFALVSQLRTRELRHFALALWLAITLFLPVVGAAAWFIRGRPEHRGSRG